MVGPGKNTGSCLGRAEGGEIISIFLPSCKSGDKIFLLFHPDGFGEPVEQIDQTFVGKPVQWDSEDLSEGVDEDGLLGVCFGYTMWLPMRNPPPRPNIAIGRSSCA